MDVTSTSTDLIIALPAKADVATFTDEKAFEDLYEKIVKKVGEHVPDVSTKAGRDAIASLAYKVARTKTTLDKQGKDLTEEWRKNTSKVNATRNTISDRLEALQKTVRKPLTDWEVAEQARIDKHQAALDLLLSLITTPLGLPSADLKTMLVTVDGIVVDASWEEFEDRAALAKQDAVASLTRLIDVAVKREADAAELAALRAAQAERDRQEADRLASEEAARAEAVRIERERLAEEQRKDAIAQAAAYAAEKAERDAQARIDAAEQEAREANERAERAAEAERQRIADEQASQVAEQQRREADIEHRRTVNNTVVNALVACAEISPDQAKKIVAHMVSGLIPNVTFNY